MNNNRNHIKELNNLVIDKTFFININTCSVMFLGLNVENGEFHFVLNGDKNMLANSVTELLIKRPDMLKILEQGIQNYKNISDNINLTSE